MPFNFRKNAVIPAQAGSPNLWRPGIQFLFLCGLLAFAAPVRAEDLMSISSAPAAVLISTASQIEISSGPVLSTTTAHVWRSVSNTAFNVPEGLEFVIRWGVITAGNSSLNVDRYEFVDGRKAYHLVSEAHSTGVVDTFYRVADRNEAWLDCESFTSLKYSKHLREGSFSEDDLIVMDQVNRHWKRQTQRLDKHTTEEKEGELPPDALDVQASLYYMRVQPLEVGKKFSFDVHSSDKIYPLTVTVLRREKVKVPAGTFDCFVVEPLLRGPGLFVSKGKKLQVWLTADDRHMPVRMRSEVFFGHVAAELIRYAH